MDLGDWGAHAQRIQIWYWSYLINKKFLGTPWEGGRLPWLYHHYAGHDDNRDWFMLNLNETKLVNQVVHKDWFPQVFLDMHQMGTVGPRIFTPPNADPLGARAPVLF